MKRKLLALGMALALTLGLMAGCTKSDPQPTPTPSPEPVPTPTSPVEKTAVNFAVLSGPSGMGAAKLMSDAKAGTTANDYNVTIAATNDEVKDGLISGSIDIAAVASNMASVLFNKTEGGVQVAAVSGLGVLYILENGDRIHSINDLAGKTVYATGQGANPEYVLNYLLAMNGEEPLDVDIQWKATADEVSTLMASGEAKIAMLPVPAATAVMMKNPDVREALDLTEQWDALDSGSKLTQTVIVVRTQFAEQNKAAVDAFLAEYAASVEYVNTDPAAAGLVADFGITPNAKVAEAAIPKANLVCITGVSDMRDAIQGYFQVLWQADPKSVGGSLPDDAFYYGS